MKNVKTICCLVLLLVLSQLKAQKRESFKFILEKEVEGDSNLGKGFEHSVTRIYSSDTIFEESGLFFGSSNFFKVKNGSWFIKNNEKWILFYLPNKKIISKIRIGKILFKIKPVKVGIVNRLECIVYELIQQQDKKDDNKVMYNGYDLKMKTSTGYPLYGRFWFNSKYGFIKTESEDQSIVLVREDIINMDNK